MTPGPQRRSGSSQPVYLHIGVPKSGTTYVQSVLQTNSDLLGESGVLVPLSTRAHFLAAQDALDRGFRGYRDPAASGAWGTLCSAIARWDGPAVVSAELFCRAEVGDVERIVDDLGDRDVRVVVTARDLGRQLPAVWQENLKNGGRRTFEGFLGHVQATHSVGASETKGFWSHQDLPGILGKWEEILGPERICVVTLSHRRDDPLLLWRRFSTALGLAELDVQQPAASANESLGMSEAEFLRRVNEAIGEPIDWPTYRAQIKRGLVAECLAGRPGRVPIRLPDEAQGWVMAMAEGIVEGLSARGYQVVGDLSELLPAPPAEGRSAATDAEVSEIAVLAMATWGYERFLPGADASGTQPRPPAEPADGPAPDARSRGARLRSLLNGPRGQ